MKKRRVLDIILIIFAFLLVISGSILLVSGALAKINVMVFISLGLLGVGFLIYIILFIVALRNFMKKEGNK